MGLVIVVHKRPHSARRLAFETLLRIDSRTVATLVFLVVLRALLDLPSSLPSRLPTGPQQSQSTNLRISGLGTKLIMSASVLVTVAGVFGIIGCLGTVAGLFFTYGGWDRTNARGNDWNRSLRSYFPTPPSHQEHNAIDLTNIDIEQQIEPTPQSPTPTCQDTTNQNEPRPHSSTTVTTTHSVGSNPMETAPSVGFRTSHISHGMNGGGATF